jgi:acetyltransferase-like isoleucine patch superfamily enzyme
MDRKVDQVPSAAESSVLPKPSLRRYLATSDRLIPRVVRKLNRVRGAFSLPAPRLIVRPMLWVFLTLRSLYYLVMRVFVCEPLFKAYCKQYGRRLRTGVYIHWVQGKGDIILGDDVTIDGKCGITFAARFADRPTLRIGDGTGIGHNTRFTICKAITIGRYCRISGEVLIFDASGHSTDPASRAAGQPPREDEVRPVVIGDHVWIGVRSMIFPGVRVGEGSTISAGSVVRSHVPPYTVVAGNPARVVLKLPRPSPEGTPVNPGPASQTSPMT